MYEYIGILLGVRPILHISRIKVNVNFNAKLIFFKDYPILHQLVKKNLIIIKMHGMYVKMNVKPLLLSS
jgi:hypothetical protein